MVLNEWTVAHDGSLVNLALVWQISVCASADAEATWYVLAKIASLPAATGVRLADGFATRADAQSWLAEHFGTRQ